MPKRTDISSILVIGAGPIVIGQACEFDYSGVQACKALRREGYRVVLVNSNPATIMTDPDFADATYIEPIAADIVAAIIARERPDALLPTLGGQTALNVAMELYRNGVLQAHGVKMLGASPTAIAKAEDRSQFAAAMARIGLECPRSCAVSAAGVADDADDADPKRRKRMGVRHALNTALERLESFDFPVVIRPSFTLGGRGGGIAYNRLEFQQIVENGLYLSPTTEVLIEESVLGWKEYELEIIRDGKDNAIVVCSIENVDPMGVHTGDSITVAPALTLTDCEYQRMRSAGLAVLREIGVETGGSNVQFAVDPDNGRMVVIEMNPRVSRSSALASKATGYPIAKVATLLAVGYALDELQNDVTGVIPASFEPTLDYVVVKAPRFAFEKFAETPRQLGTAMKSVGEAMAIGRRFEEALQKAFRSMETGLTGIDEFDIPGSDDEERRNVLREWLKTPIPDRLRVAADALRLGIGVDEICAACRIDRWFIERIEAIVAVENELRGKPLPNDRHRLSYLKAMGFSDARLAALCGASPEDAAALREELGVRPVYKRIDSCAGEFPAVAPYMYATYETTPYDGERRCEADPGDGDKVVILGGGPNRIGQGIEFDYCCCHAAFALSAAGFETIMVNCNPETVSTDYDASDRLYFEPLTDECVLELIRRESEKGRMRGAIVQLGGQTPLGLAAALDRAGVPILGTQTIDIDRAEDRDHFSRLLAKLGLNQPRNRIARNRDEARAAAEEIGYPAILRPSYVLGGRAMQIMRDRDDLDRCIGEAVRVSGRDPVLVEACLQDAVEVDVDALADGRQVRVCGVMEHIEMAGVHSGDSACVLPPHSLSETIVAEIRRAAEKLAVELNVIGLMNVQFAVHQGRLYVLEVNPRASRTVPFVSKALGTPLAAIAARLAVGARLSDFDIPERPIAPVSIKEAVFSFSRFPGVDVLLGPEMRSTGEVMGLGADVADAFAKSQLAAGVVLPVKGEAFVSVKREDRNDILKTCRSLAENGFNLCATEGTANFLKRRGLKVRTVNKIGQARPHILDDMKNGDIAIAINTPSHKRNASGDSRKIRQTALQEGIPYYTTAAGAAAAAAAAETLIKRTTFDVVSLQAYAQRRKDDAQAKDPGKNNPRDRRASPHPPK